MGKSYFKLIEIFTASTAAQHFNIPYSTIKDDLTRRKKFDEQIKNGLAKKEGRVWLITGQAIKEVYKIQEKDS